MPPFQWIIIITVMFHSLGFTLFVHGWFWMQLPGLLVQAVPTGSLPSTVLSNHGETTSSVLLCESIPHLGAHSSHCSASTLALLTFWGPSRTHLLTLSAVGGLPHEYLSSCTTPNKNQELRVFYSPCHMAMTTSAWKDLTCRTHKSVQLHSKTKGT